MNLYKTLLSAIACLFAGSVLAAPIAVQTVAEKEIRTLDADGQVKTSLVPADAVVPGDQVVYTVTFTNNGDEPASKIVVTDPVPEQMRYVDGSAFGPLGIPPRACTWRTWLRPL
jgi:uncharacterized repeat protein (TIGR01451 family)